MTSPSASEPPAPAPKPGSTGGDAQSDSPPVAPASELTPEEQMERFERELKETDWGHQPC